MLEVLLLTTLCNEPIPVPSTFANDRDAFAVSMEMFPNVAETDMNVRRVYEEQLRAPAPVVETCVAVDSPEIASIQSKDPTRNGDIHLNGFKRNSCHFVRCPKMVFIRGSVRIDVSSILIQRVFQGRR